MSEADVESVPADDQSVSDHWGEDENEPFLPGSPSVNGFLDGLTSNGRSKESEKTNGHRPRLLEQLSDLEEGGEDDSDQNMDTTDDDDIADEFLGKDNEDFVEEQAQKRMAELVAEEKEVTNRLRKIENEELEKAKVVQGQRAIYDLVVDIRIRMEALMTLGRRFPSKAQRESNDSWENSDDLSAAMSSAQNALSSLASQTAEAFGTCWSQDDDDDEMLDEFSDEEDDKGENNKLKKKATDVDEMFTRWRTQALDEWGENTRGAAEPKGGFKVIDTSVSGQVKAALDSGKALSRTRKVHQRIMLLGDIELEEGSHEMHFDDGELYRALLREIIEGGDGPDVGRQYAEAVKSGRVKKKTDRSFAKGKRLQYKVHEKLVGFLAPLPMPDPGPIDEIVATIFGKMGTIRE